MPESKEKKKTTIRDKWFYILLMFFVYMTGHMIAGILFALDHPDINGFMEFIIWPLFLFK